MARIRTVWAVTVATAVCMAGEFPTHRDPIQWPFADTSI